MADERDPELQALARSMAELSATWTEVIGRAVRAWMERNRAALEALAGLAADPRVRAYIEARERGELPPRQRPCLCLCGRAHPADTGVCDGETVTTRHYELERYGPVDVPLCAPCAAAQFLAEVAGG